MPGFDKTFDPKVLDVIFGAPITGFMDGTFLTVARDTENFKKKVGADGEGARAKTNNKSGTITLTLIQTSASNDYMSGLALADELNNDGVVPLLIKDRAGRTLLEAGSAWIEKWADVEYADDVTGREWTIGTTDLRMFIGGS